MRGNLNTSNVNVNRNLVKIDTIKQLDLNTSNVNVNLPPALRVLLAPSI